MDYLILIFLKLLDGVKITILIFTFTFLISLPLGLLGAILKKTKYKLLLSILNLYTWFIRGTPLLLQLYFCVYGIPILLKNITGYTFRFNELNVAIITFIINYTAYFIEIFRGGMNAINKGQFEACQVLGLSKNQTYLRVILPQTIKKTIPSITNEAITLVKDTALVSAVSIFDLLNTTKRIVSLDFRFEAYFISAIIYLLLTYLLVFVFKQIEKKYSFYS